MPLVSIEKITGESSIGIWSIDESSEELIEQCPEKIELSEEIHKRFKSESRRREYAAVRLLLYLMTGNGKKQIKYHDDGAPYLDDLYCSISHTKGYATLIISSGPVAIDIEYISPRVEKVTKMFLRNDEKPVDLISKILYWSAKETLYKYFHEDNLTYSEMRIQPFRQLPSGTMLIENMKRSVTKQLRCKVTEEAVITVIVDD